MTQSPSDLQHAEHVRAVVRRGYIESGLSWDMLAEVASCHRNTIGSLLDMSNKSLRNWLALLPILGLDLVYTPKAAFCREARAAIAPRSAAWQANEHVRRVSGRRNSARRLWIMKLHSRCDMSMAEIGKQVGCTRERVRQIVREAETKG